MDLAAFRATLAEAEPPPGLSGPLRALWWDAKGDWSRAHEAAQEREGSPPFDRVHAYLHRKEGDEANARYWYRRAGRKPASGALETEWAELVRQLLASRGAD